MIKKLQSVVACLLATTLVACGGAIPNEEKSDGLTIVAATELKDMEPLIEQASKELGFGIKLDYPDGTIANSQSLKAGEFDKKYDATWFATNKYVDLYEAGDKLGASRSVATSPIALGVNADKARELGWHQKQPTWADITKAVQDKRFHFGMTDPSRSNSGFSALVSVATANADTGAALQSADMAKVQGPLRDFFKGQNLTSGSSGWLEDAFLSDPGRTDAIVTYESVLLQLKKQGKANIEVVVPADGVVTADYPLAPLKNARTGQAAERTEKLATWLGQHNGDIVKDTMRRPVDPAVPLAPEHRNTIIEMPFPARQAVADELLMAFSDDLRAPAKTIFVLDKSGSMRGNRINSLHEILTQLVDGTARTKTGPVGMRNREDVTIIGFNGEVDKPYKTTYDKANPAKTAELKNAINTLQPGGQTAVYDALKTAFEQFPANPTEGERIPSIVLMSDGASNSGMTYDDFERYHRSLSPQQRRIPVFIILYGESNNQEMKQLADLTEGKTFDATKGDLAAAFKEIRGYQ